MKQDIRARPYKDIADRIKWHRELMDLSQQDYAERAGLTRQQLNNWETGLQRLSLDGALALREIYGLSLDFMYTGNPDTLSMSLRKALIDKPLDKASR